MDAKFLIEKLGLKPLPLEGGFFRETYRSPRKMSDSGPGSEKSVATCIYFLLCKETFSALHKLPSDEIWHFYAGDPVQLHIIDPQGELEIHTLSSSLAADTAPQVVVKADHWQGAALAEGGSFALLGCTVAPAFDFADYQHGDREVLLAAYPQHEKAIFKLTREQ